MTLPLAHIERIMRNAGADKVTEDAVQTLRESTMELGEELARDAMNIARQDGRTEITVEDVQEAVSL